MKKTFFSRVSWIAVTVAVLFTAYILLLIFGTTVSYGPFSYQQGVAIPNEHTDTAFGGVFYSYAINDSLPYHEYRRQQDSIERIKNDIKLRNLTSEHNGAGMSHVGIASVNSDPFYSFKDSFHLNLSKWQEQSLKNIQADGSLTQAQKDEKEQELQHEYQQKEHRYNDSVNNDPKKLQYYLTLEDYSLPYDTKFYTVNNQNFLAVVEWGPVVKRKYDSSRSGHYIRKMIPVRYNANQKKIYIPVSKGMYGFLNGFFHTVPFIIGFVYIYILIGLPLQLLYNISRGRAFTKRNIWMLRIIGIALFIFTITGVSSPYILRMIFGASIPSDFILEPFINSLFNNFHLLLASAGIFIVSIAFQKGYKLQEEQELTV